MGSLFGSTPSVPAIPVAPPAATPPVMASAGSQSNAASAQMRMRGAAMATGQTNTTGPQGLVQAPQTGQATLLGQ